MKNFLMSELVFWGEMEQAFFFILIDFSVNGLYKLENS